MGTKYFRAAEMEIITPEYLDTDFRRYGDEWENNHSGESRNPEGKGRAA